MESSLVENTPVVLPITCRPARSNWVAVGFLGLFGLMSLLIPFTDNGTAGHPPDLKTDWIMAAFFCPCFLIPAMLWAIWTVRACIIADENCLRWCGLGRWHSAHWAEVTDYYEQLPQKRSSPVSAIIETATGRLKFDASWRNCEALRLALTNRAVNARVKEWGIFGTRFEDEWPRVFDYEPRKTRRTQTAMGLILAVALVVPIWPALTRLPRDYGTPAFGWDLAGLGLWCLTMGSYFGLVYYVAFRQSQGALRHANQHLVADTLSLTLHDKGQITKIEWQDVVRYSIAGTGHVSDLRRYVVAAKHARIEFLPTVRDARILAEIVSRFAVQADPKEWRRQESDVLGGAASRWSGGCEGVGERIFGYRTRMNRAFLWFPLLITVLPVICYGLDACLGLPGPSRADFPWTLYIPSVILLFWAYWRYRVARIQIDAHGITQCTLLGRRFLAWHNVQGCYKSDGDILTFYYVADTSGARLWFWLGIADLEELQDEIARRAICCPGQSWEKKERRAALAKR